MAYCLKLQPPLGHHFKAVSTNSKKSKEIFKFKIRSCAVEPENAHKLVVEVKKKLEKEHNTLPVGKNGRDDEEMILWFLKDRNFSVEDAVSKLNKAIRWRHEVGVSELSEESVKSVAETGKACVHDFLDIYGRPVLIVEASKHFPGKHERVEDEKLSAFLIEKALSKLPAGKQEILGIIDLRGFRTKNIDIKFLTFAVIPTNWAIPLFILIYYFVSILLKVEYHGKITCQKLPMVHVEQVDAFYCYYPRRLGRVLFVEAPFVFKPVWQLFKPLLKSSSSLVRFCSVETIREEYFAEETVPARFGG